MVNEELTPGSTAPVGMNWFRARLRTRPRRLDGLLFRGCTLEQRSESSSTSSVPPNAQTTSPTPVMVPS